jgi:oxygen-independent coproporphyrinogen-3 oxidase
MAGLYFHIPFCKSKCSYCNFYSVASLRHLEGFSKVIINEMRLQCDYLDGKALSTLYFGGGTPSLMAPEEVGQMIGMAKEIFSVNETAEITLEANPEPISTEFLIALQKEGVTRISVGLQSLYDAPLVALGRSHDAACSVNALECLAGGPIGEISVDLIYGVPGLTDAMLLQQLQTLVALNIPHISAYALTVEEQTAMHHLIKRGKLPQLSEEQSATQYILLMEALVKAGYKHYEISNFCLPGHHSHHNSAYWDGTPYLGLGPSAHSYNGNSRQWNVSGVSTYIDAVEKGQLLFEREMLSPEQRFNETIMTRLRTSSGISIEAIESQFGPEWTETLCSALPALQSKGWIEHDPHYIRLTPSGKLHADGIAADLFRIE